MLTGLPDSPAHPIVLVYGPMGVGKSSLLMRFGASAEALGLAVRALDLGRVSSRGALMGELSEDTPGSDEVSAPAGWRRALEPLRPGGRSRLDRTVLLLDDLPSGRGEIADVLARDLVPSLPPTSMAVFAAERRPAALWSAWAGLPLSVELKPWTVDEIEQYLARLGLGHGDARAKATRLHALTGGRPSFVAMACDLIGNDGEGEGFDEDSGFVEELVDLVVEERPEVRDVLAPASVPHVFDDDLLARLLDACGLAAEAASQIPASFLRTTVDGRLAVPEIVRRPLYDAFARRRPTKVRELHAICQAYFERERPDSVEALYHNAVLAGRQGVVDEVYTPYQPELDRSRVRSSQSLDDDRAMNRLDERVYGEELVVDQELSDRIFERNHEMYRVLEVPGEGIKGYYGAVPLTRAGFDRVVGGSGGGALVEGALFDEILPPDHVGDAYVYFSDIVVDPDDHRRRLFAARLLRDWVTVLERMRERGTRVRKVCCIAVTAEGRTMAERLGLRLAGTSGDDPIYAGSLEDLLVGASPLGRALARQPGAGSA